MQPDVLGSTPYARTFTAGGASAESRWRSRSAMSRFTTPKQPVTAVVPRIERDLWERRHWPAAV